MIVMPVSSRHPGRQEPPVSGQAALGPGTRPGDEAQSDHVMNIVVVTGANG